MSRPHLALCIFAVLSACAPAFDDTRAESDPGTFGHHVVDLMCKRIAFEASPTDVSGALDRDACLGGAPRADAPSTLVALTGDRDRTVAAVDALVPPAQTDALQAFLTQDAVLGLYDDDTMGTSVAQLGGLLGDLGGSGEAMAALARIGARDGYRDPAVAIGQLGQMVNAPEITPVMDTLLPQITVGGGANAQWNAVIAATAATLADASPAADPATSAAAILDKLLLTSHSELAAGAPLFALRRDGRGVAKVVVAAPFVDIDGDGAADVDAEGRFVGADGAPLVLAPPFAIAGDTSARDPEGRSTEVAYAYYDIDSTIIGALGRDAQALLDPAKGTALDALRGAALLLGDRAPATRTFDSGATFAYQGYDTTSSPLLDMSYAVTQMLRDPHADDTLALADQLVGNHQASAARLLEDAILTARLGDAFPAAQIVPTAPLWDDMRPLLQKITADPKLVHDLLEALKRPETAALNDRFREFMTYTDRFDIDPSTQAVTGTLHTPVDRAQPDNGFNRSLWQRLLMVISDSNGASQCNKQGAVVKLSLLTLATYDACTLFKVDNLAVFYLQSIAYAKDASGNIICEDNKGAFDPTKTAATPAGCAALGAGFRPQPKANFNYNWNNGLVNTTEIGLLGGDGYIESQATITGFRTHPTPEALDRVLFLDPTPQTIVDTADPMRDKDGDLFKVQHAGTLAVWEKNDFFDEIRPIVQAFADAGQEQTFVDLMSVMHEHWSSPASTATQHTNPAAGNYTYGSNGVSYEPLVIAVFQGDLWPALVQTAPDLTSIVANGKPFSAVVATAGHFLVSPLPGLADRQGVSTTRTAAGVPVTVLSPWHLMADAFLAKRARLAAAPPADAARWTDSVTELEDLLVRGTDASGTWQFTNPRTATTTRGLLQLLRDRLVAHDAAGDRTPWLATDLPKKTQDLLTHPLLAAATDLIAQLDGAPRTALETLLAKLMDPAGGSFQTMRSSLAELVGIARDDQDLVPIAHVTGALLAKGYLPAQVALLTKLHAADGAHTLTDIVARVFQPQATQPGVPIISAITDGLGDVDRMAPAPGPGPVWTAADYAATMAATASFLTEQQHGLLRFIAIVKGRNP